MKHALRALGLNLKHWSEDYPGWATILAGCVLGMLVFLCGILLAHARGCEPAALGEEKETMGGCGAKSSRPISTKVEAAAPAGIDSGQPPILNAVAPGDPAGLRFEDVDSGRGKGADTNEPSLNTRSAAQHPWGPGDAPDLRGPPPIGTPNGQISGGRYPSFDAYAEAVIAYESAGETVLVGDGGDSRGPAHIQLAYWTDTGRCAGDWFDGVMDRDEAKQCIFDYARRYEPDALARGDWETLARLHNGGPNWRVKPVTAEYWRRVKANTLRT